MNDYDQKHDRFWQMRGSEGEQKVTVELKSVNHRYLDVNNPYAKRN